MRILFVDSNDKERQLYSIYLENSFNLIEVVEAFEEDQAIEALEKNPNFDLILYSNNVKKGQRGPFVNHVREFYRSIPFVFFSADLPDGINELAGFESLNPKNCHILLPISPVDFRTAIAHIVQPSRYGTDMVPAFQKVKVLHFLRFNKVLCDVYLKLSDHKYVKVINRNAVYHKEDIDRFHEKDIEYLFIRNDDFEKFQVNFTRTPFLAIDSEKMTTDEKEEILAKTHMMMKHLISNLGFSEEVVEMTEKSIDEVSKMVTKMPSLSSIYFKMREKSNYIYDHSYLVSIVCCEMLHNMHWSTERRIQNLCMAAMFHDMTLENPELAMIQEDSDPNLAKYTKEEVEAYLGHPYHIAEILNKAEFVPMEVKTIIRQHHENITGTGFPQKLHPSHIPVLVATFIVAHDYVRSLYDIEFDSHKEAKLLEKMRDKYSAGNFKSPMEAFYSVHSSRSPKNETPKVEVPKIET